jgi:hypothetical protein
MGVGRKKKPRGKIGRGSKSRASALTRRVAVSSKRKKSVKMS